jgi:hypothetical protein
VLADAVFEIVLGLTLLAIAATDAHGALDLPGYMPRPAVGAGGLLLLPVGGFLWWMAQPVRLTREFAVVLAVANVATGMACYVWLGLEFSQLSVAGRALVDATATALVLLGVLELVTARRHTTGPAAVSG